MKSFEFYFLIVFYVVFIGRSILLRLAGTNPFVIGKGKMGLKAFIEILLIPSLLFWSWEVLRQSMNSNLSILPDVMYQNLNFPVVLGLAGIVLTVAGFALFVMALISFGSSWRVGIDNKKPGELVTTGMFKYSRNPIFLFIDLYFIGTFLVYPNMFFGLSFIIVVLLIHYQIIQEEKHLNKTYGEKYSKYMQNTPRYLGF
jgi:protein-S-isoprenylcysteine O-methyltransferase Ste14